MQHRSPAITALLAVIALVLLPAISNIEANALPASWTPFLWIAWPAGVLLATPLVYLEMRHRHHRPGPRSDHGADSVDEQRHRRDRAVTDLAAAVTRQWTDELGRRSVRSAAPLRVRWSSTSRPVALALASVVRQDVPHRPQAVRGDTAEHIVEFLSSLRDGQLLILGEPGAGKTVLATLFVLQLLEHRQADDPVPVLLTVSSWNPTTEDLSTWLARRIVEEYPALGNEQVYGVDAATALVADGRVLAVLDGLDEMPTSAQPTAIAALDRMAGAGYPMVVTCRGQEYQDAVTCQGEFLRRAAVVEIQPVELADAAMYLIAATPAGNRHWQPVLDYLTARPDAPLARVVTSPLMISLARTVYAVPASSPEELLDGALFATQNQIESHLLDRFIQVAYRDTPASPDSPLTVRYSPQRAQAWLAFLARHLCDQNTGDLAWWHLLDVMPRIGLGLATAVPVGLLAGLAAALVAGLAGGTAIALVYGLGATLIVGFGHPRPPTAVQLRFHGTTRPFLGRLAVSCAVGIAAALAFHLPVPLALESSLVLGLTLAVQVWLDAPTDARERSTPGIALRQNRTAALGFGLTLALASGFFDGIVDAVSTTRPLATLGPLRLLVIGLVILVGNGFAGYVIYGWVGGAGLGLIELVGTLIAWWIPGLGLGSAGYHGAAGVRFGIAFGLAAGVAGVLSRAWGSFCLARIWLALCGHLPWRLMRFLDDAHRRGVLRQSGAVYQFRHAKLRDQLALTNPHMMTTTETTEAPL